MSTTTPSKHLDSLTFAGETWPNVTVTKGHYPGGALAVALDTDGDPLTVASVNLAPYYGLTPKEGAIFVKDHDENAGILAALEAAGVLRRTGRQVTYGYGLVAHEAEVLI